MTEEAKGFNILQIICFATGMPLGIVFFKVVLGAEGIIVSALSGGFGAILGLVIYAVVNKIKG